MRQYERSGITVDQCTECRGIFLDRGELEKLFEAEATWNRQNPATPPPPPPPAPPAHGQPVYGQPAYGAPPPGYPPQPVYGGHPQGGYGYHGHKRHKRHKSFLNELFD
jgi:uncharacterized protein